MKTNEPGMRVSDKCRFCKMTGIKVRPYMCCICYGEAREMFEADGWGDVRWISITKHLPEPEQHVQLRAEDGQFAAGYLRKNGTWHVDLPRGSDFNVAFWRAF